MDISNAFKICYGATRVTVATVGIVYSTTVNLPISFTGYVCPVSTLFKAYNWGQIHVATSSPTLSTLEISLFAHSTITVNNSLTCYGILVTPFFATGVYLAVTVVI